MVFHCIWKKKDESKESKVQRCLDLLNRTILLLEPLLGSNNVEVQERATSYLHLMKWLKTIFDDVTINTHLEIIESFASMFNVELIPVHPSSQEVIAKKIPAGLDLDKWIGDPWPESEKSDDEDMTNVSDADPDDWFPDDTTPSKKREYTTKQKEDMNKASQVRKERAKMCPFMLPTDGNEENNESNNNEDNNNDKDNKKATTGKDKDKDETKDKNKRTSNKTDILQVELCPQKNKKKKTSSYTVRKLEFVPGLVEEPKNDKKKIIDNDDDELAKDMDFTKPTDDQFPIVRPYPKSNEYMYKNNNITNNNDENKENDDKKK